MQAAKETEERGLRRYERGKEDVGGGYRGRSVQVAWKEEGNEVEDKRRGWKE